MGKKVPQAPCIFGADFMRQQVKEIENEIDNVLAGEDIEVIHRIRVASRRLRNGLELFKDCLPKKKAGAWQDHIRIITHSLGKARDLDIQIALLNRLYDESLDAKYKPGFRRLLLRLKQRRSKAQKQVNRALLVLQESKSLKKMRNHFEAQSAKADSLYLFTPSLYQRASTAINRALADFLSYQEVIHSPENIDKLHAMRLAGKKLRYTLEIFAPIYKHALIPHIQVMKEIQDQLGSIHDDDVWVNWIPKFIDKEQSRIEDYFGNTGPLKRLLPGLHYLQQDRTQSRDAGYRAFLSTWETLQEEKAWETLRSVIMAPINVEAALAHLDSAEKTDSEGKKEQETHNLTSNEIALEAQDHHAPSGDSQTPADEPASRTDPTP